MALSSCALIGSIQRDCRDNAGGIIEIKVKVLPTASVVTANYTVTSGTVTIATGSRTGWYTWDLEKNTCLFSYTQNVNVANGTREFKEAGTIILNKIQASIDRELNAVGQNSVQIAVKYVNGIYQLYGYEFGMDLITAEGSTGTTKEDRNGYTIQFEGSERYAPPFMSSATYDTLVT